MNCKKKRIIFVINPISGHGDSIKASAAIDRLIDRAKYDVEFIHTTHRGHATQIAAQAAREGVDIVAAVGGDGTVNEVASGLVGTATALAIVPRGSGNGLAFHLKISKDIRKAIAVINEGNIRTIDSATFDSHPFFCTAGMGYDAKVAMDYARDGHRGLVTYAKHAIKDWKSFKAQTYHIETEDTTLDVEALLVTVGNANQWGNNCHITPGALVDDGLLNITIIHPLSAIAALPLLPKLMRYSVDRDIHVTSLSARKVKISRNGSLEAHYDGEAVMASNEIVMECIPGSLKVVSLS